MEGINQTHDNYKKGNDKEKYLANVSRKISRKCITNDKLLWYQIKIKNSPLTINGQFPKLSVM
jgi:hypothetical protein